MKTNIEGMGDDWMRAECKFYSRLEPHKHIVQFLGAVIEEPESEYQNQLPSFVYKMFIEFASSKWKVIYVVI